MVENITLYPVTAHLLREFVSFVEDTSIVAQLLVCWVLNSSAQVKTRKLKPK